MSKEFTVVATSGYQGAGWKVVSIVETKDLAQAIESAVQTTDARSVGYITRVCGAAKPHPRLDHAYLVRIDGKQVAVDASDWMVGDGAGKPYPHSVQAKAAGIISLFRAGC